MFNENDVLHTTLVMTLIISAVVRFLNTREFRSNICCPGTEMSCRTTLQDIFFCVLIHFYVA